MKNILQKQHPKYWNGVKKENQSFFNKNLTIEQITNYIEQAMELNKDYLATRGNVGLFECNGTIDGKEYVIGFNNGRVVQYYIK